MHIKLSKLKNCLLIFTLLLLFPMNLLGYVLPSAPFLNVEQNNTLLTISWTTVDNVDGYSSIFHR